MKNKYTIDEQIEHMKCKGILFNLISEDDAKKYLITNTYYFKIKSFAKSFIYNPNTDKYINVDFEYLIELSKLDMYLRQFIIQLSLDTEHFLKVELINDLTNNPNENGYDIVNELFLNYPYIKKILYIKSSILQAQI